MVYSNVVHSTSVSSAGPTAPREILEPFLFHRPTDLLPAYPREAGSEAPRAMDSSCFSCHSSAPVLPLTYWRFAKIAVLGILLVTTHSIKEAPPQSQNRVAHGETGDGLDRR